MDGGGGVMDVCVCVCVRMEMKALSSVAVACAGEPRISLHCVYGVPIKSHPSGEQRPATGQASSFGLLKPHMYIILG